MSLIFKPKRGKKSDLKRTNPLLQNGELCFEIPDDGSSNSGVIKIGDGKTKYNDLNNFIKNERSITYSQRNQLGLMTFLFSNYLDDFDTNWGWVNPDNSFDYSLIDRNTELSEYLTDSNKKCSCAVKYWDLPQNKMLYFRNYSDYSSGTFTINGVTKTPQNFVILQQNNEIYDTSSIAEDYIIFTGSKNLKMMATINNNATFGLYYYKSLTISERIKVLENKLGS